MSRLISPLVVREGREFTGLVDEHMFGMMYQTKPQYMSKVSTALFERNEYMTVYSYIKKHFPTVYLDNDNESVGKKIRSAEVMKVPYSIVIGEKEIESGQVTPRIRGDLQVELNINTLVEDFLQLVESQTKNRTA